MISEKRKIAARLNGARSRGPVTPAGKSRSSRNAITHGLLSKHIVIGKESREAFDAMMNEHLNRFSPDDEVEQALIEEMATAHWRLRRLWAVENQWLQAALENQPPGSELVRIAAAFGDVADSPRLGLLHRYETRLHLIYQRAFRNLVLMRNAAVRNEPKKSRIINGTVVPPDENPTSSAELPPPETRNPSSSDESLY